MQRNRHSSEPAPIIIQPPPCNGHITIHAVAIPTRKRRGEAAEAAFLARATYLGFTVLIPWGDSNRYDSVVELDRGFLRVQVKSATRYAETRYRVKTTGANGRVYTSKEIDFFVAYVVPENLWYIIPIQAIGQRKGIRFYPTTRRPSRAMFEKYREAWCLLDSSPKVRLRKSDPSRAASRRIVIRHEFSRAARVAFGWRSASALRNGFALKCGLQSPGKFTRTPTNSDTTVEERRLSAASRSGLRTGFSLREPLSHPALKRCHPGPGVKAGDFSHVFVILTAQR